MFNPEHEFVLGNKGGVILLITERNDIMHLLFDYIDTEHERTQIFWGGAPEWEVERAVKYFDGVVLGKYREKDPETIKVLNELVSSEALYKEVQVNLQNAINAYKREAELDIFQKANYKAKQDEYEFLRENGIDEWVNRYCIWLNNEEGDLNNDQIKTLLYIYYSFDNHKKENNSPYNPDISIIKNVYDGLFEKQSQFKKYGLLPVDTVRELLEVEPPRIYDKGINKTLFTKNIPLRLLKQLKLLKDLGYIKDIAIRVKNEKPYEGKLVCLYLAEALERGQFFCLSELGAYSITRLYSEKYDDCLWVEIDERNITFEELCEDFTTYENVVVTQVIHLEYQCEDQDAYITHLDHEYIFYTLEEYEQRLKDNSHEGSGLTRLKSFKIDHSRIPFNYEIEVKRKGEDGEDLPIERVQILSYILETYFSHKDLLKEYFQSH
jgi:hypothetical protein